MKISGVLFNPGTGKILILRKKSKLSGSYGRRFVLPEKIASRERHLFQLKQHFKEVLGITVKGLSSQPVRVSIDGVPTDRFVFLLSHNPTQEIMLNDPTYSNHEWVTLKELENKSMDKYVKQAIFDVVLKYLKPEN
ncbi:hypothetical protein HUU53_02690 [Candidatus Micrarchaeota archaeon]|nr:hypothetical protein [Candidatus Micrarchaeota archaeon]